MTRQPATDPLPQRVHLVGIGGAGLSGLARVLQSAGHRVSGTDRSESSSLEALRDLEIGVEVGESRAEWLAADVECVVHSAAIDADDPQLELARERGLRTLKYAQTLPLLAGPDRLLGVAGTHGKTTTSWMLWNAVDGTGDVTGGPLPGALIGGISRRLGTNALAGSADGLFVVEACEYDKSFLNLAPHGAIVTNVEADHLDSYGSLEAIHEAFGEFAGSVHEDGLLVVGEAVPESVEERARCEVWRLGRELQVQLAGESLGRFRFRLQGPGFETPELALVVPGRFNVENAAQALALAVGLARRTNSNAGECARAAVRGLARFQGVFRRFETWGVLGRIDVVHDYAHHPTEVAAVIEAARRRFPRRKLFVLFQPHQHSRTARFLSEFVESLRGADSVFVTDVYGARSETRGEQRAGASDLVTGLRRAGVEAEESGNLERATFRFVHSISSPSVALVIGAGDVEEIKHDLLHELALRSARTSGPIT